MDITCDFLFSVSMSSPNQVEMAEFELTNLCLAAREIFLKQPTLLELEAPLKICG